MLLLLLLLLLLLMLMLLLLLGRDVAIVHLLSWWPHSFVVWPLALQLYVEMLRRNTFVEAQDSEMWFPDPVDSDSTAKA